MEEPLDRLKLVLESCSDEQSLVSVRFMLAFGTIRNSNVDVFANKAADLGRLLTVVVLVALPVPFLRLSFPAKQQKMREPTHATLSLSQTAAAAADSTVDCHRLDNCAQIEHANINIQVCKRACVIEAHYILTPVKQNVQRKHTPHQLMSKQKKRGFSDLQQSHASSHSPYEYDEDSDIGMVRPGTAAANKADSTDVTPSQAKMGPTLKSHGSEDSKMLLRPEQDKRGGGLHGFAEKGRDTRCSRLCKAVLSIEKGEAENFAGETILLKSVLVILGVCFVVSTTAFIVTACAIGLEEEGYDRYMANHSKMYHAAAAASLSSLSQSSALGAGSTVVMGDQEMMAMQRLQGIYDNITADEGGN